MVKFQSTSILRLNKCFNLLNILDPYISDTGYFCTGPNVTDQFLPDIIYRSNDVEPSLIMLSLELTD